MRVITIALMVLAGTGDPSGGVPEVLVGLRWLRLPLTSALSTLFI